jgi:hypothetical protein
VLSASARILALDRHRLFHPIPPHRGPGLDDELCFGGCLGRHVEPDWQAAGIVGLPLEEGDGPPFGRLQADLHVRAGDGLVGAEVLHHDAHRRVAIGGEAGLSHDDCLLVVDALRERGDPAQRDEAGDDGQHDERVECGGEPALAGPDTDG